MIVNTVALEKGLNAAFAKASQEVYAGDAYAALYSGLATEVPSTSSEEKYGWLGDVPEVREWLGDKNAGNIADYDYTVKNADWEDSIAIDRNEIKDDKLGIILPRIAMLAQKMKSFRGKRMADLLIAGTTNLAYDGSAFFANRTSPNDNLLAGTGHTIAQLRVDIYAARAAMMKFQSDKGAVMGLLMDTIVCPPELEGPMLEAVFSASGLSGYGMTNPINKWIKQVIVLPNASDADDWYGCACGMPLRPLFWQNREDVTTELDDTESKRNRKLTYSAVCRGQGGYGFFQMAVKTVNT